MNIWLVNVDKNPLLLSGKVLDRRIIMLTNKYGSNFPFSFKYCFTLLSIAEMNKVFTFANYKQRVDKYIKIKIISYKA